MNLTIDSFWRALVYCLHPRVIWLSLLPLGVAGVLLGGLAWLFWGDAVQAVRTGLDAWSLSMTALSWLDFIGAGGFRTVVAPLIVVALAIPVVLVVSLLTVAIFMMPAMVQLVARRRFPTLAQQPQASWAGSLAWSLGSSLVALFLLLLSLPLWLIPPFALLLPPLIWGWLAYRVMSYDALSLHATAAERRELMRLHRTPLLTMGVVTGYLGAAPSALWAIGGVAVVLAPLLVLVSVWLYTLVFAFSALWFAHYLLAALHVLRSQALPPAEVVPEPATLTASGG